MIQAFEIFRSQCARSTSNLVMSSYLSKFMQTVLDVMLDTNFMPDVLLRRLLVRGSFIVLADDPSANVKSLLISTNVHSSFFF